MAGVGQSFGRFTLGVLLPAIRDDLGLSNTLAGSLGTANVGAYLIGTLFVAAVASRVRLLAIMRFGLVLATAGLLLAAVAPGPLVLGVAQLLSGFGGACAWIPAPVVAVSAVGAEKRGVTVGLLGSGMGLGVVFTGQLSGYVRSTLGDESWRTVYAIQAVIAIVVLAAVIALIGYEQGRPSAKAGLGGFSALRRMRGWAPLTSAYSSFGLMYLLVIAFLTTRLEDDSDWTSSRASLAFTLVGIAMVFGGPTFITIAGRVCVRRTVMAAFILWAVLTLVVLPGWFFPTLAASVGLGLLFAALPTMVTLYVVDNTTAADYGPSFAAATLAFGVAQMVSPQLGGLIADLTGSFTTVFALSSLLAVTGLVAAHMLPRDTPQAS